MVLPLVAFTVREGNESPSIKGMESSYELVFIRFENGIKVTVITKHQKAFA